MCERPTVYVGTVRTAAAIREDLTRAVPDAEYTVRRAGLDAPVANVTDVVELVDGRANVVFDRVNTFETAADIGRYIKFLNKLKTHLSNIGGVGVLLRTRTEGDSHPARRHTLTVADLVWRLETRVAGDAVETVLQVRKFRSAELPDETVKLHLGPEVRVDTSRNIS